MSGSYSKKRVYAFEMGNGLVKIGVSCDVDQRTYTVSRNVKCQVVKIYHTSLFSSEKAYKVERACHAAFADKRAFGEFFNITFAEACKKIDEFADTFSEKTVDNASQLNKYTAEVTSIHLNSTTIKDAIMRFAKLRGYTQKALREEYNKRYGTEYNQPTFSRKLARGVIRYDELQQFGDILNFDVVLKSRD